MSATPEQLRAVADAMEHDNLNKPQYEQLMAALPEPYRYMMDRMRYSDSFQHVADAVALRLRLEAALAEQAARRVPIKDDGHSCGPVGAYHQPGCDWERCGKCGGQRITCGCDDEELVAIVRAALGSTS